MEKTESKPQADSIVCYCLNRTHSALTTAYARCGSLKRLQDETRVGTVCGGCRIVLESLFEEKTEEILNLKPRNGAHAFFQPGTRFMRGLLIADGELDTVIYSSNGVPPQYGHQEMGTTLQYAVLDAKGALVLQRQAYLKTYETFSFDTRKEQLPRPFYGTFIYVMGRTNYGASRFNTIWKSRDSSAGTHENTFTGRPKMVLPIIVDEAFLAGPNEVRLAMQNPHGFTVPCQFRAFDVDRPQVQGMFYFDLPPQSTRWFRLNEEVFRPTLARQPGSRIAVEISCIPADTRIAPAMYFFVHNRNTGIWNANHI